MSRNFGLPARQEAARAEILSAWTKDILAAAGWVICFGCILAVLFIEFPNGLRDVHVGLVLGDQTIILNR